MGMPCSSAHVRMHSVSSGAMSLNKPSCCEGQAYKIQAQYMYTLDCTDSALLSCKAGLSGCSKIIRMGYQRSSDDSFGKAHALQLSVVFAEVHELHARKAYKN